MKSKLQLTVIGGAVLPLLGSLFVARADPQPPMPVVPLRQAHAHNDYNHPRPLFDALDHGFCSVEADIFLVEGSLLVAHDFWALRRGRTLESLYLDPLRRRVQANGGQVYKNGPTFWLLVDVKSEPVSTYRALDQVLGRYQDMISVIKDGKLAARAITVVLTGNRAVTEVAAQKVRYVGIDGRVTDLDSTVPVDLMPWISPRWTTFVRWRGEGPMPPTERAQLKTFIQKAHQHGRMVRFWDCPETSAVWQELLSAGADLINTDKLADLQHFLLRESAPKG